MNMSLKQFDIIVKQLSDENEISINFIDEFIEFINDKQEEGDFWNIVCTSWNRLFYFINNHSNYPKDKINKYIYIIIKFVNFDIIEELNIENDLLRYIENSKEILQMVSDVEVNKVQEIISKMNIKFNIIDTNNVNKELLTYIWDGCFYNINKEIINDILTIKCNYKINKVQYQNYTSIKNSDYNSLITYIEENIKDYINNVFLDIEENNNESIDYIIELLNKDGDLLSDDIKLKIIDKEEFSLLEIEDVSEKLWESVLLNSKVEISWSNIIKYYNYTQRLDDTLIKYFNISEIYNKLSLSKCENDEVVYKLFREIIESEKIETNSFRELVKSINWIYPEYDTSKIRYEHMVILIEHNKFKFNVKNYENIRENFDDIHIKFIELNSNEFIKNINEYVTDANDLYKILTLNFTIEDNKVILSKVNEGLSNQSLELSEDLREIVSEIVMTNKGEIEIGIDLYWEIFDNMSGQEKKINLLSYQSRYLKEEQIKKSLDRIGKRFSGISSAGSKVRIFYSESVLQLANSLVECGYILSKSIKPDETVKEFVQFNQFKSKNVNK